VNLLQLSKLKYGLFVPFSIGVALFIMSWYFSYPLSLDSADDFVFYHVSTLYWISLPILFSSMFLIAASFKNKILKWMMAVGIVILLYSIYFFCHTIPGSDSHYFRGITIYSIGNQTLDSSLSLHSYYEFPLFFVVSNIATLVSGLPLTTYEFIQFSIIGLLLVSALFVYASKSFKQGGFLAPVTLFVAMFYFIDYQNVPFALGFALLFVLFMLDTYEKSLPVLAAILLVFSGLSMTHLFVPLFFVIYLLVKAVLKKSKYYLELLITTIAFYFTLTFAFSWSSFSSAVDFALNSKTEYGSLIGGTFAPVLIPTDVVAQVFSRIITISVIALCVLGTLILLKKRKLRDSDKAILITGLIWSGIGFLVYTLGSRTFPVVFITISLGAAYLFENKRLKKAFTAVFLVILLLLVSIPIHNAFSNPPIMFQTEEDQQSSSFLINNFNWNADRYILSDDGADWFIAPQVQNSFDHEFTSYYNSTQIHYYDSVIYTVVLSKSIQSNVNEQNNTHLIREELDVVYDSGSDYIAIKVG
jgi:hypothetical protein